MDLKIYFRRIREIEESLPDPFAVIISEANDDGAQGGIPMEVSSHLAAKMVVERRARLATAEESATFHETRMEAKKAADQLAAANRMQITVVPARPVK